MDEDRTRAGMEYTDDGVRVLLPKTTPAPPKRPWEPKVGTDTRDLRDPQRIGRRILANVKRRKKGKK